MRSSVVLPQPDGPTMQQNWPSGITRSTSRSASTGPPRAWNDLLRPLDDDLGRTSLAGGSGEVAGLAITSMTLADSRHGLKLDARADRGGLIDVRRFWPGVAWSANTSHGNGREREATVAQGRRSMIGAGWWSYLHQDEQAGQQSIDRSVLRRVAAYARPYVGRIALMLLTILAITGLTLVPPLLMRALIDDALPNGDSRPAQPAGARDGAGAAASTA